MKTAIVVGILLIVLGIISLAYQGISHTREKKIVDLGPIQATEKTQERIPFRRRFWAQSPWSEA